MHGFKQYLLRGGLAACLTMASVLSPTMAAASVVQTVSNTTSIYGYDQYETAAKIAQNGWTGTSDYAILAAGMPANLIDALAAGPLAARLNAPIILTEGNSLTRSAKAELTRLKAKKVYVTSGSAVIKQSVLDEIKAIGTVSEVKALGGMDASETSVNIAKEMANQGAKINKVVVTGGAGSDALSVAAIAGSQGMPILYTRGNTLSTYVKTYLESFQANIKQTYVIGGSAVISEAVKAQIPGTVERYSGRTQYDTNIEVLKNFVGAKNKTTYVANGETMVDALAGVPLVVKTNGLILLTGKTLPEASKSYAQSNLSANVIGLGGDAVVSGGVLTDLASAEVISQDGINKGSNDAKTLEQLKGILKVTGKNVIVKNAESDYSIYVQGDNVTLNNVTVKGTIFLDPGDIGTATLQEVNATNIVVLSGGSKGISLANVKAQMLDNQSSSPDVLIKAIEGTKIERTVSSSSASFDAAYGTSFGKIRLSYFPQSPGAVPVVKLIGNYFPTDMTEIGEGVQVTQTVSGGVGYSSGSTNGSNTSSPSWNSGDSYNGDVTVTTDNTYGPNSGLFSIVGDMTLGRGSNTSMILQNVHISGTLTLNPGPTGTVNLNNVTAGNVVVQSGASHSIYLIGVTITGTLTVNAPGQTTLVHIVTQEGTTIGNTLVKSGVSLQNDGAGNGAFGSITLNTVTTGAAVQFGGAISSSITVAQTSANLTVQATTGSAISGTLTINAAVTIQADGEIANVQVAASVSVSMQGAGTVTQVTVTSNAGGATVTVAAGTQLETVTVSANCVLLGSGEVGTVTATTGMTGILLNIQTNVHNVNSTGMTVTPATGSDLALSMAQAELNAQTAMDALAIGYTEGDSASAVTQNVSLPSLLGGYPIVWNSSNSSVINNQGEVTRPAVEQTDVNVTLTATFTAAETSGSTTYTITKIVPFVLTVKAFPGVVTPVPVVTSIVISGGVSSLMIPTTGETTSAAFTATVKDQSGNTMPGESVIWSLGLPKAGVSVNTTTGAITVQSSTTSGSITLVATSSTDSRITTTSSAISLVKPVVTSITISGGVTTITIPASGGTTNAAFEASVKDQNGNAMAGEGVTWSLSFPKAGVSVNSTTGAITIQSSTTPGTIILVAASTTNPLVNTTSAAINIEIPVVTSIEINDVVSSITIPTRGVTTTTNCAVTVLDQCGVPMVGEHITWSLSVPTDWMAVNPLTGAIIVSNLATSGSITLVATSDNGVIASADITLLSPPSDTGFVAFEYPTYELGDSVNIIVLDADLRGRGTLEVNLSSSENQAGVTVQLQEVPLTPWSGTFIGWSEPLTDDGVNGSLKVSYFDVITVTYVDEMDEYGVQRTTTASAIVWTSVDWGQTLTES